MVIVTLWAALTSTTLSNKVLALLLFVLFWILNLFFKDIWNIGLYTLSGWQIKKELMDLERKPSLNVNNCGVQSLGFHKFYSNGYCISICFTVKDAATSLTLLFSISQSVFQKEGVCFFPKMKN